MPLGAPKQPTRVVVSGDWRGLRHLYAMLGSSRDTNKMQMQIRNGEAIFRQNKISASPYDSSNWTS